MQAPRRCGRSGCCDPCNGQLQWPLWRQCLLVSMLVVYAPFPLTPPKPYLSCCIHRQLAAPP
jgi:hypothetical protein